MDPELVLAAHCIASLVCVRINIRIDYITNAPACKERRAGSKTRRANASVRTARFLAERQSYMDRICVGGANDLQGGALFRQGVHFPIRVVNAYFYNWGIGIFSS